MTSLVDFLLGCIAMGSWVAGLFFFKFWSKTRDRIFLIFGIAFWTLALERLALVLLNDLTENQFLIYILRLLAFALILSAILDKNRKESRS